jgi:hypothetical protein
VKIQLPDGRRITLDENITLEEKIKVVEELTEEWIDTIILNWHSDSIKFFLDNLSNYLNWHKDEDEKNYTNTKRGRERGKQDKEILSIKRIEEMEGKRKARSIPFSSLSTKNKENLGISERGAE